MTLAEYQNCLDLIPFGKRLPTAVYVFREEGTSFGAELDRLVAQVVAAFQVAPEFNVIKFRTDELKTSFLAYPDFLRHPHPALRHAITIDLVRGKARETDYAKNPNPPILHRKEAFLPAEHPKRALFAALTEAEEGAGLYAHVATIGFKLNWERLVKAKGLSYSGHELVAAEDPVEEGKRHLTPALSTVVSKVTFDYVIPSKVLKINYVEVSVHLHFAAFTTPNCAFDPKLRMGGDVENPAQKHQSVHQGKGGSKSFIASFTWIRGIRGASLPSPHSRIAQRRLGLRQRKRHLLVVTAILMMIFSLSPWHGSSSCF